MWRCNLGPQEIWYLHHLFHIAFFSSLPFQFVSLVFLPLTRLSRGGWCGDSQYTVRAPFNSDVVGRPRDVPGWQRWMLRAFTACKDKGTHRQASRPARREGGAGLHYCSLQQPSSSAGSWIAVMGGGDGEVCRRRGTRFSDTSSFVSCVRIIHCCRVRTGQSITPISTRSEKDALVKWRSAEPTAHLSCYWLNDQYTQIWICQ